MPEIQPVSAITAFPPLLSWLHLMLYDQARIGTRLRVIPYIIVRNCIYTAACFSHPIWFLLLTLVRALPNADPVGRVSELFVPEVSDEVEVRHSPNCENHFSSRVKKKEKSQVDLRLQRALASSSYPQITFLRTRLFIPVRGKKHCCFVFNAGVAAECELSH